MNSDSAYYGGSNVGNLDVVKTGEEPLHGFAQSISLTLPPLACLILEPGTSEKTKKQQPQALTMASSEKKQPNAQ